MLQARRARRRIATRCASAIAGLLGSYALLGSHACQTDLNVGKNVVAVGQGCEGEPCGSPCMTCDPETPGCEIPGGFCSSEGVCVSVGEIHCSTDDPCAYKRCGDSCRYCEDGEPNCVEPDWNPDCPLAAPGGGDPDCDHPWPKVCNAFGRCVPDIPGLCNDPTFACHHLECGDRCCNSRSCDGPELACDADGACVVETWAYCAAGDAGAEGPAMGSGF